MKNNCFLLVLLAGTVTSVIRGESQHHGDKTRLGDTFSHDRRHNSSIKCGRPEETVATAKDHCLRDLNELSAQGFPWVFSPPGNSQPDVDPKRNAAGVFCQLA